MRRVITIAATLLICLGCLIGAAVIRQNARLLAVPVEATIASAWVERGKSNVGEPVYYARLVFDRIQNTGGIVHCDVPRVRIGQSATIDSKIEVFPHATSCREPYVKCKTCARPSDSLELSVLIIAIVSGLICAIQIRGTLREKAKA